MTAQRERFARLIAQGVSNSEACRLVGVNRKTGQRWRHGRSVVSTTSGATRGYPPVLVSPAARAVSSRYLSEAERVVIADRRRAGMTCEQIAAELGRATSTVGRELRRHRDEYGRYGAAAAQRAAAAGRARPRARRVEAEEVLRAFVIEKLTAQWSPAQISNALRARFPEDRQRWLCPESVYQAIYDPLGTLGVVCAGRLRTRRARRRPHRRPDARRAHGLPGPVVSIRDRPAHVADRLEPGHWEGDSIMGPVNRSAIVTLVERTTRQVRLVHLGVDRGALAVRDGLIAVFSAMPATMRRTLTWDRGTEMAGHLQFSAATGMPVYFCDPHSPWRRGSNENGNGLLRGYFPKGTDLSGHGPARLAAVEAELNDRPRKTLRWQTPAALYADALHRPVSPLATPRASSKSRGRGLSCTFVRGHGSCGDLEILEVTRSPKGSRARALIFPARPRRGRVAR